MAMLIEYQVRQNKKKKAEKEAKAKAELEAKAMAEAEADRLAKEEAERLAKEAEEADNTKGTKPRGGKHGDRNKI